MQETRASGYDWTGSPMAGQESLTTCPTAWEDTINFPDAGGSPPTSVWLGVPLTCMNCTATGTSLGSGMFVRGDSAMHSERSYKWISSLRYGDGMFSVCLDGYLQWVDGYIYDGPEKETVTVISGAYPVFQYRQTPAFFRGMDFDLRFTPGGSWDYHAVVSLYTGKRTDKG